MKLKTAIVKTGRKTGVERKKADRLGFEDENRQTYLPPKTQKRSDYWAEKMKKLGFEFI